MSDIIQDRYEKLRNLKERGIDPFGGSFSVSASIKDLLDDFKEGTRHVLANMVSGWLCLEKGSTERAFSAI